MKLIILDRDGVINHDSDNFIKSVDEWSPIEGSLEAITKLQQHGYKIVVLTNQSGIARGFYTLNTLFAMHDKFRQLLQQKGSKVDAIFYCPHGPDDACDCRKPDIGLYKKVQALFSVNLENIVTVGDSYRDLEAAIQVGSLPVLVKTGKGERTLQEKQSQINAFNIPVFENLAEFVNQTFE